MVVEEDHTVETQIDPLAMGSQKTGKDPAASVAATAAVTGADAQVRPCSLTKRYIISHYFQV